MSAVDLFDAWARWSAGDTTLRDARLWSLPIFWWGRIGKFAAFFAGLVLVLDIIGPERITRRLNSRADRDRDGLAERVEIGREVHRRRARILSGLVFVPGFMIVAIGGIEENKGVLLVLIGVFVVHVCLEFGAVWLPRLAVWIYSHDRAVRVVRIISLVAFVAGFHFDMLAS